MPMDPKNLANQQNSAANKQEAKTNEEVLIEQFRQAYRTQWLKDSQGFFGWFRKSRLTSLISNAVSSDFHPSEANLNKKLTNLTLNDIFFHGMVCKGYRTLGVMKKLGWINEKGEVINDNPILMGVRSKLDNRIESLHDKGIYSGKLTTNL